MLITIIFSSFAILGITDLLLRKKYNIERNEKFMDQYVNRTHIIIEIWFYVMFLLLVSFKGLVGIPLYVILFIFFALIFAIRAFLELIFKRQSKRYIISLMYTGIGLIGAISILLFG